MKNQPKHYNPEYEYLVNELKLKNTRKCFV